MNKLQQQIDFIQEIEKLKTVTRKNLTLDNKRPENSAEHSWHVTIMAVLLCEYSNKEINTLKVLKMLLVHDLVEIDCGDTWLYDEKANESKNAKELNCADRIFNLLPENQRIEYKELWLEFEKRDTNEAQFAASIDAMQPLLNHRITGGDLIKSSKISVNTVIGKKKHIADGSNVLWKYSQDVIADCTDKGIFVA